MNNVDRKLMYKVVFTPTYVPWYHYYIQTPHRNISLGYLPAGIDTTYRNQHISTITMMQFINNSFAIQPMALKHYLLKTLPNTTISNKQLYNIQKHLSKNDNTR